MELAYMILIFAAASALFVAMRRVRKDKFRKVAREKELAEFEKEHPPRDRNGDYASN